jgi:hypothetical protein
MKTQNDDGRTVSVGTHLAAFTAEIQFTFHVAWDTKKKKLCRIVFRGL